MKQRNDIEKRVEETLNSLDGIQRATPQPWLFSRVKARLIREEAEERTVWGTIGSFLSKPVVAIAGLCLILILNGFLLFNQNQKVLRMVLLFKMRCSHSIVNRWLPAAAVLILKILYNHEHIPK